MAPDRKGVLRRLDQNRWELPPSYKRGMRVPGVVYADERMLPGILGDQALDQVANVACLPGIVSASLAMPDIHWGYGFPIGGVAATRVRDGVVSPGGVGFDINCGVRLVRTDLTESQVRPVLQRLVDTLYREVPSGVGSAGRIRLKGRDVERVLTEGAGWAVAQGYGVPDDLAATEEGGAIAGADPDAVGLRPRQRGADQLGTLGAGNHFLEVQAVEEVYDSETARAMGVHEVGQVMVMFHCGSRGFGHQVCQDALKVMDAAMHSYDIRLPDRQLACAPVDSPEGRSYLAAMRCAANFAWANRQCILHWVRRSFSSVLDEPWERLGMHQVYDVAHNIAKIETHVVDGQEVPVCVHRKGATRAFPPGSADLPPRYQAVGQPVIVPGDMGRYSFLCVAGEEAMTSTFGTTCHGAGRTQSRGAAKRMLKGRDLQAELRQQGILVRARGWASLAEEASVAYKDVAEVVGVCDRAGLSRKVARLRPLGVIKG